MRFVKLGAQVVFRISDPSSHDVWSASSALVFFLNRYSKVEGGKYKILIVSLVFIALHCVSYSATGCHSRMRTQYLFARPLIL